MRALFSNAAVWLPITVALGVQFYKMLADWIQTGKLDPRILAQAGGMPSSHSAMVVSLATVCGYVYGLDSAVFAISVIMAIIVMYDARGVRQESGKQARVINQIVAMMFSGNPISEDELKELIGHTTLQVIVGAFIGMTYSLGFLLFRDWLWPNPCTTTQFLSISSY
ncbi:MAG: divergent PAP2 family protein [Anaerolineales bacterium]|nr:divergent PAP2 family protein [Anaerolineales bacterium]